MGAGVAAADPTTNVLRELQDRLTDRLDILLSWETESSTSHLARIPECELALTRLPVGYKLTAIFLGGAPLGEEDMATGLVERGRRVLKRGARLDLQRLAIELARHGVRGGPAYDDGPLKWSPVPLDGSLRMAVPGGELRIHPLAPCTGNVLDDPDDLCALLYEDIRRVYPMDLDTCANLQGTAVTAWQMQKTRRPLQLRLDGKCVYLRSAGVPGVLGYHAVAERTFLVIAWVNGEIGLFYVDGYQHVNLARLTFRDLRNGEIPDVDALLRARARTGAANEGPTVFVEPSANGPHDDVATTETVAGHQAKAAEAPPEPAPCFHAGRAPGPAHLPMAPWHRDLCERHLRRLRARLKGRGARKARQLVSILLEAFEMCRDDIGGSRVEVHDALARILQRSLPGGNRNIRDCMDLLARESPLFRRDEGRCAVLFAQLHDPGSELIRRIADEDARLSATSFANADAAAPPAPPPCPSPADSPGAPASSANSTSPSTVSPPGAAVPPATQRATDDSPASPNTGEPQVVATPTGAPGSALAAPPTAGNQERPRGLADPLYDNSRRAEARVFEALGAAEDPNAPLSVDNGSRARVAESLSPVPPQDRGASSAFTPSPHAAMSEFVRGQRLLYDDPDDPFDPEIETLDSPSRRFLASRQKPPRPETPTE